MPTDGDAAEPTPTASASGVPEAPGGPADMYWLGVGIRLGLEHPDRARAMLLAIEAGSPAVASAPDPVMPAPVAPDEVAVAAGFEAEPELAAGEITVRSMLIARSAAMPLDTETETMFGWAARLTAAEVTWMGRVVGDMLGSGASKNLGKGFGLAWNGNVKLPQDELRQLFGKFSALEVTISSVLAGRDLRESAPVKKQAGIGSLMGAFLSRSDPLSTEAAAVLDRGGEPAQRGLVAIWNAWAALRYRDRIPAPLFDDLVRPWTTVIGSLPEG